MADNSYPVEVKLASKNGWFTPDEARSYYGRYSRVGITVHWWGDGTGASNHDNIVNYMNNQAALGNKSVNYVLSDNKITLCVGPDNVAWCSQAGNPTTISVETQPTLGAAGYKKWGWLVDQLEQRYGRTLTLYRHSDWYATACPGSIDLNRIRSEANKWKYGGEYNPAPTPQPAPAPTPAPTSVPTVTLQVTDIVNKKVRLIRDTQLWDLGFTTYAEAKSVKPLVAGTILEVSATAQHPLGSSYYLTEYSFSKGIRNGINVKDCEDIIDVVAPPTPVPAPAPEPVPMPVPITKDEEQDKRLSAIEALLQKIVAFLSSIFSNFKP